MSVVTPTSAPRPAVAVDQHGAGFEPELAPVGMVVAKLVVAWSSARRACIEAMDAALVAQMNAPMKSSTGRYRRRTAPRHCRTARDSRCPTVRSQATMRPACSARRQRFSRIVPLDLGLLSFGDVLDGADEACRLAVGVGDEAAPFVPPAFLAAVGAVDAIGDVVGHRGRASRPPSTIFSSTAPAILGMDER